MTAINTLLTAANAAADTITAAATEYGATYHACQSYYGVAVEVLVDGEWVDAGDLESLDGVEAVRLYDCDGERSRACRTIEQIEAVRDRWIESLKLNAE
jgi:hypothetical protein